MSEVEELEKLWGYLKAAKAVIRVARERGVHGRFCSYLEDECTCGRDKLDRMIKELPFSLEDHDGGA